MIKWFQNEAEANSWMRSHPEAHMVCMSSGSISGSLFVGFLVPPSVLSVPSPDMSAEQTMLEVAKHEQAELDKTPKRRGRPPKVKNA